MTVQGTVPYLGTFLTDLMMIDSALKDLADDDERLINFDKHRKEFEILSQIRLLQAAAALYHIRHDPEFHLSSAGVKVYDDTERCVLQYIAYLQCAAYLCVLQYIAYLKLFSSIVL